MFAIVEDRGKQYKVSTGDEVLVDRMDGVPGAVVDLEHVLLLRSPSRGTLVGTPHVEGASVAARVLGAAKGPKLVAYKLRRRKNSRTKKGHRQAHTRLRITRINPPADWA
jgi:large subunit ribosomal protein L21